MRPCRSYLLIGVCVLARLAGPAAAQSTYTWNTTSASDWLTAGNWSGTPSNFPGRTGNNTGNNAADQAVFGSTLPTSLAIGIDMSITGAKSLLQLGAITFANSSNDLLI